MLINMTCQINHSVPSPSCYPSSSLDKSIKQQKASPIRCRHNNNITYMVCCHMGLTHWLIIYAEPPALQPGTAIVLLTYDVIICIKLQTKLICDGPNVTLLIYITSFMKNWRETWIRSYMKLHMISVTSGPFTHLFWHSIIFLREHMCK